jgi:transcriptional regulator with XRE-family HTH domain
LEGVFVDLPKRIKLCREKSGLLQSDMAEKLNITRQAYNHYETQKRVPPLETLFELAEIFGVSLDYLTGRTDNTAIIPEILAMPAQDKLSVEICKLSQENRRKAESFIRFLNTDECS